MPQKLLVSALAAGLCLFAALPSARADDAEFQHRHGATATPIKHVVVIFQENVSFDHYFGTYPLALNPAGEPAFHARPGTPAVNGLTADLLTRNPNYLNALNGAGALNPFRLGRDQAATADQDHDYTAEQVAFDGGRMDLFPAATGNGSADEGGKGLVMGYYDGNTVTALWNYAQRFAMSDNSYGTTFGPSTPGAINLVSGQTNGIAQTLNGTGDETSDGHGGLTLVGDADPIGDVCSSPTRNQVQMSGRNIGDLLNAAHVSWGWFEGGFDLGRTNANGSTGCKRSTLSDVTGAPAPDYIPHHQPFQYYASTANPSHARPSSLEMIGHAGDAANHQYDLEDFFAAVRTGNFPAVSFLKASGYQDGHAGYSDPLDEQAFLVRVTNFLQSRPQWRDTAVVIAYDDSDGWYDHQIGPIVNASQGSADALDGDGQCGSGAILPGVDPTVTQAMGRCGYGPRLPLLVISPWAKTNYVDHAVTDQSSVLRFIEDNWLGGQRLGQGSFDVRAGALDSLFDFRRPHPQRLFLRPDSGQPLLQLPWWGAADEHADGAGDSRRHG
jgi:phospholipase C